MVVSNGSDIFVIGGVLCSNIATTVSSVYHYDATDPATSPTRMPNDCLIGMLSCIATTLPKIQVPFIRLGGSDHYCTVTDALAFGRGIICVRNPDVVYLPLSKVCSIGNLCYYKCSLIHLRILAATGEPGSGSQQLKDQPRGQV